MAERYNVTVAELDAANQDVNGYGGFLVGTVINIPFPSAVQIATTIGLDSLAPTSTSYTETSCVPAASTIPVTTSVEIGIWICGEYTLEAGDFPGSVADKFQITVSALDYANKETVGYGGFMVGTKLLIPCADSPYPTTTTSVGFSGTIIKVGTSIQVVNCSYQEGVAGFMSDAFAAEGFTMVEADTGTIDLAISKVIYNPDDPAALAVAQTVAFFLGNAVVEASGPVLPTLTLGTWAPGSSVVVLLGDDLAGKTLAQIAGQNSSTTTTASRAPPVTV